MGRAYWSEQYNREKILMAPVDEITDDIDFIIYCYGVWHNDKCAMCGQITVTPPNRYCDSCAQDRVSESKRRYRERKGQRQYKTCCICGGELDEHSYKYCTIHKGEARKSQQREYQEKNKEKIRAWVRDYNKKHRERVRLSETGPSN